MSNRPKLLPEIGTGLDYRLSNISQGLGPYGSEGVVSGVPYIPSPGAGAQPVQPEPSRPRRVADKYDSGAFSNSTAVLTKNGFSRAYLLRREVMRTRRDGGYDEKEFLKAIREAGIDDPGAVEAILGTELTENVVKYFLGQASNDSDKAMILAKKFGY